MTGIDVDPKFGIGQRSYLVHTGEHRTRPAGQPAWCHQLNCQEWKQSPIVIVGVSWMSQADTRVELERPGAPLHAARAEGGNLLWDCLGFLHPDTLQEVKERVGGIDAIAVSHPHFYIAMADWAEEFGCQVCHQLPQLPALCRRMR